MHALAVMLVCVSLMSSCECRPKSERKKKVIEITPIKVDPTSKALAYILAQANVAQELAELFPALGGAEWAALAADSGESAWDLSPPAPLPAGGDAPSELSLTPDLYLPRGPPPGPQRGFWLSQRDLDYLSELQGRQADDDLDLLDRWLGGAPRGAALAAGGARYWGGEVGYGDAPRAGPGADGLAAAQPGAAASHAAAQEEDSGVDVEQALVAGRGDVAARHYGVKAKAGHRAVNVERATATEPGAAGAAAVGAGVVGAGAVVAGAVSVDAVGAGAASAGAVDAGATGAAAHDPPASPRPLVDAPRQSPPRSHSNNNHVYSGYSTNYGYFNSGDIFGSGSPGGPARVPDDIRFRPGRGPLDEGHLTTQALLDTDDIHKIILTPNDTSDSSEIDSTSESDDDESADSESIDSESSDSASVYSESSDSDSESDSTRTSSESVSSVEAGPRPAARLDAADGLHDVLLQSLRSPHAAASGAPSSGAADRDRTQGLLQSLLELVGQVGARPQHDAPRAPPAPAARDAVDVPAAAGALFGEVPPPPDPAPLAPRPPLHVDVLPRGDAAGELKSNGLIEAVSGFQGNINSSSRIVDGSVDSVPAGSRGEPDLGGTGSSAVPLLDVAASEPRGPPGAATVEAQGADLTAPARSLASVDGVESAATSSDAHASPGAGAGAELCSLALAPRACRSLDSSSSEEPVAMTTAQTHKYYKLSFVFNK